MAVARVTSPSVIRRTRVVRIGRSRVVRQTLLRSRPELGDQAGWVVPESRLCRDDERRDTECVRGRHRRALEPAEGRAVRFEAREVEKRRLERIPAYKAG